MFAYVENAQHGLVHVERVHVHSRRSVFKELFAHFDSEVDSVLFHGRVIVLDGLHGVQDVLRDARLAKAGHLLEAAVALDGHDAGDDGDLRYGRVGAHSIDDGPSCRGRPCYATCYAALPGVACPYLDPYGPAVADKLEEEIGVVKELRDDQLASRVDLVLEVEQVLVVLLRGHDAIGADLVGVGFGVAGDADAEKVAILFADVLDLPASQPASSRESSRASLGSIRCSVRAYQIQRALEATLDGGPALLPCWWIATERQDVLYARVLDVLEGLVRLFHLHVGARQVHHRLDLGGGDVAEIHIV